MKYICKQCGKKFAEKYSKWSNGDFCCKSCACKYSSTIKRNTINIKLKKIGENIKRTYMERYYKNPKLCCICNNIIPYEKRKSKTCCKRCERKQISNVMRLIPHKIGGYVPNSCRGKHGWYRGIYCDSTYELAYLIYCLDHNIDIKRCDESFEYELNGIKHTYHPDFIVDGIIVEIKNYYRELNDIKLNSVNNPSRILYFNDLIPCFEYVSKTYNKYYKGKRNNFYELYDKT